MTAAVAAPPFADDESRWAALVRRDRAADGAFLYSVATTGVYCRPTCAARLAKRVNVRFHATPDAAERAGFRACKRCRPDGESPGERQRDAVAKACRLLDALDPVGDAPDLAALADAAGMSRFHFHRVFKAVAGVTPKAYAAARRVGRVRDGLAGGATVTEALYAAGHGSSGPFYATSAQRLGMTPGAFRAGGRGEAIRYAVGACSLGSVLVAATAKGVCALFLGDAPDVLVDELRGRFPRATLTAGDAAFDGWVATVVGLVEQPASACELPLDVRGTAFQVRVWEALRAIPPGTTATYADVAARIGHPTAVRAVGTACGANPVSVIVPCHRVVRADESLAGYRWGVTRKAELLKRERLS